MATTAPAAVGQAALTDIPLPYMYEQEISEAVERFNAAVAEVTHLRGDHAAVVATVKKGYTLQAHPVIHQLVNKACREIGNHYQQNAALHSLSTYINSQSVSLKKHNEALKEQAASLLKRWQSSHSVISEQQAEIEQLKVSHRKKDEEIASLMAQLVTKETKLVTQSKQLEDLIQRLAAADAQRKELSGAIATTATQFAQLAISLAPESATAAAVKPPVPKEKNCLLARSAATHKNNGSYHHPHHRLRNSQTTSYGL